MGGGRLGRVLGAAFGLLTAVFGLWLVQTVRAEGPVSLVVGGWAPPLGIALRADALSATLLLVSAVVGTGVTVWSMAWAPKRAQAKDAFFPLWLFLWGALNALFVSGDLFNLYVTLELLSLASVALVALEGGRQALRAALRYLFSSLAGSLLYLLGVALLYGAGGALDPELLSQRLTATPPVLAAAVLCTVGLCLKTALFPLHFWLPSAHGGAPAPVSAALSGLVVKASFYVLLRVWFDVLPSGALWAMAPALGVLGGAAVVWGSVQALRQRRLKRMVAHSTVAQLGYLFLALPLVAAGAHDAWRGALFLVLSHALAKSAMFLAAGAMVHAAGSDRMADLRGLATALPVTTFTLGLAGMTLMGLPPSGGFLAKWYLLLAAVRSGQWWWGVPLLLGGLLAAAYLFSSLRWSFLPAAPGRVLQPVSPVLKVVPLVLAVLALAAGVRSVELLALFDAAGTR